MMTAELGFPGSAWMRESASLLWNKVLQTSLSFAGACSGAGVGSVSSCIGVHRWPESVVVLVLLGFSFIFNDDEVGSGGGGDNRVGSFSSSTFAPPRFIRYGVDGGPVHEANSSLRIHVGVKRNFGSGGCSRWRQQRMEKKIELLRVFVVIPSLVRELYVIFHMYCVPF
jgi:hypothetical protein